MTDIDIVAIDSKIHALHQDELAQIKILEAKRAECEAILSKNLSKIIEENLTNTIKNYDRQLKDLMESGDYQFYLAETVGLIEEYKQILRTPMKVTFLGQPKKDDSRKKALVSEYLNVVKKFPKFSPLIQGLETNTATKGGINCDKCNSKQMFLGEGANYVCIDCGYEKEAYSTSLSYKDISRTNILQKDTYERRSHFRDCINQFQGKQNCKIDPEVYKRLEQEFEKHHLLVGDENTPREIRFKNVLKEHVKLFLTELNYDKQYDNVNYIFSKMTGKSCPDISHLEEQLMSDFDLLVNLYMRKFKHEKKIERKSFMNIQYVFFQLLTKNKYPCKKEDFNILKTIDRKAFHDDVFKELFEELGWNHTPFF